MYLALRYVVEEEMRQLRTDSPYPLYAVQIDEATDSSNQSVAIMFIRYMGADGMVQNQFLAVSELTATTADEIFATLQKVLAERGLFQVDLIGFASDGAAVMVGVRNGVATKLKEECPWFITNHCMAHRLQLVAEKAANEVPYLTKYIGILNLFAKKLKYSPKLCRLLEAQKELTGERARKIKQIFFTRWLSFADSVQALCGCVSSVILAVEQAAMEKGTEGRAVFHGLSKQMRTYRFVVMTHLLADSVGILALLSRSLQRADINYCEVQHFVETAILSIRSLLHTPGPYTKEVLGKLPSKPDGFGCSTYDGREIKDTEDERKKTHTIQESFLEEVVDRLESIFPDTDTMQSFQIFSPRDVPQPLQQMNCLELLLQRFSPFINREDALLEWQLLQLMVIKEEHRHMNLAQFYEKYLHINRKTFPNLAKLAAIGTIIPVTSVECERGVIRYTWTKTDSRCGLTVSNTESLLTLALEAKPLASFDFDRAFQLWVKMRDRRGYSAMMRQLAKEEPPSHTTAQDLKEDLPLDLSLN